MKIAEIQRQAAQLKQIALQKQAIVLRQVAAQKQVARTIQFIKETPSDRLGMGGSVGLHLLVVLFFALQFLSRSGLPIAADQMGAIPINMDLFIPPPPKKDFKIPEVIETASQTPQFIIEKIIEKPKKKEEKKEEKKQQAQPAVAPSYLSLVRGILERAKRYPRAAYLNGETGDVLLWFIINKQGTVLGFRVEKPSRVSSLDQETVALIKRVRGFPPVPPEMGNQDRWEFTIPIRFTLK